MSKYVPLTSKMMPDACAVFQDVANKINVSALMLKISSATGEMPFTDDELIYILSHADHLVRHSIPLLPRPLETPSDGYMYLYSRDNDGTVQYKNDGIEWIKKNTSSRSKDDGLREREDYVLHKSGVLCSFKAVSATDPTFRRYRYSIKKGFFPPSSVYYKYYLIVYRKHKDMGKGFKSGVTNTPTNHPYQHSVQLLPSSTNTGRLHSEGQHCANNSTNVNNSIYIADMSAYVEGRPTAYSWQASGASQACQAQGQTQSSYSQSIKDYFRQDAFTASDITDTEIDNLMSFCDDTLLTEGMVNAIETNSNACGVNTRESRETGNDDDYWNPCVDESLVTTNLSSQPHPHVESPFSPPIPAGVLNMNRAEVSGSQVQSLIHPEVAAKIIDFAPMEGTVDGGTKVLIILNNPIVIFPQNRIVQRDSSCDLGGGCHVRVQFGKAFCDAELISPTVVRCYSPAGSAGKCTLSVLLQYDDACGDIQGSTAVVTPNSISLFTYVPTPGTNILTEPPVHTASVYSKGTTIVEHSDKQSQKWKVQKMRLVERLGDMSSALSHEDHGAARLLTPAALNAERGLPLIAPAHVSEHIPSSASDTWLDDATLSGLSIMDLEKMSDNYIMFVVNQLVNIAAVDDDLLAELDALDQAGYALLHYCCIYNLFTLVPILLAKGANIDVRGVNDVSALQLASMRGNLPIVSMLVSYGADVGLVDADNKTAADLALMEGHNEVFLFITNCPRSTAVHTMQGGVPLSDPELISGAVSFTPIEPKKQKKSSSPIAQVPKETVGNFASRMNVNSSPSASARTPASPSLANTASSADHEGSMPSSSTSTATLLQNAFSSLSLTDKCALSLSLNATAASPCITPRESAASSRRGSFGVASTSVGGVGVGASEDEFESNDNGVAIERRGSLGSENWEGEVRGVISESDQESLGVAMSLMAPNELEQVEEEVVVIQNNVRAWLLRKNYINLRDAAMTLQVAWRERKSKPRPLYHVRMGTGPRMPSVMEEFKEDDGDSNTVNPMALVSGTASNRLESLKRKVNELDENHLDMGDNGVRVVFNEHKNAYSSDVVGNSDTIASTRLQALTRGMLARKSFGVLKKQAIASLVIQRSVGEWWGRSMNSNSKNSDPNIHSITT